MDLVSLALAKKHSENIAAGIEGFRVEGNTIYFTVKETQQELSVTVPTPADGVSVTKVEIRKNNHLYCTLSNGEVIDAGKVESKGDGSITIKVWDKVIEPEEDGSINLEIPGYSTMHFGEKENLTFVKYKDMGEDYWNLPKEFWDKFDNFEENFPNSYIKEDLDEKIKIAPIGFESHFKEEYIESGHTDIKIYNSELMGAKLMEQLNNPTSDINCAMVIQSCSLNGSKEWVVNSNAVGVLNGEEVIAISDSENMQETALIMNSIDVSLLCGEKHIIKEDILPQEIASLKNVIKTDDQSNIFLKINEPIINRGVHNSLLFDCSINSELSNFNSNGNVILGGKIQGSGADNSFAANRGIIGGDSSASTFYSFVANRGKVTGWDNTAFNYSVTSGEGSFAANSGEVSSKLNAAFNDSTASGDCSFAANSSQVTGKYNAAFNNSIANGNNSFAIGDSTVSSYYGFSSGIGTTSSNFASVALGKYSADMNDGGTLINKTGTVLTIGNGTKRGTTITKSNAFSVQYDGTVAASGTITASTTADYAENFEWFDANIKEEDRVGYFVTLEGNKIRKATPEDDYILGVVSGAPFVLGNGDCDVWNGLYMRDDYGRIIMEPTYEIIEEVDEETGEITYTENKDVITGETPKINPDYDPELKYIPRRDRAEWAPVGMLGVLSVRQDGTLKVNGYAGVSESGIATAAANGYRVIEVLNNEVARIIFR